MMAALKKQRKRQTDTWAVAQSSSEDEGAAVPMLHAKPEHESVQRDNSDEQIDANFSEYGLSDGVVSPDSDCGEYKDHEEPDEGNNPNLGEEIAAWATTNKCTRSALNALLLILRRQGHRLPKDARTLLQTPQRVESLEKCGGQDTCCGIISNMLKIFAKNYFQEDCLHRLLTRSPPHRYKSRSRTPHHQRQSRSRSRTPHHRRQSSSRSKTPHHRRQSRSRSKTPHHQRQSRSRTPHHQRHSNSRSWSPHHQRQSRSRTPHHQRQSNSRSRTPHRSRSKSPYSPPRSRSTSKIHNNSHVQQRSTDSIPRARIRPRGMGDVLHNEGLFQKRVIGLLQDIKKGITEMGKRTEPADSLFNLEQIETMEEMLALESRLEEAGERQTLLSQLAKIGGVGIRDNVGKVMSRLLTNKLMAGMNVKGNGGKYAFGGTNLYKVVIGSIQQCQPGATETAITKRLAECLKGAPDRKGGGGRKATVWKTEVD